MGRKKQEGVSEKQAELYHFIVRFVEQNGFQPTIQECADQFSVTKRAILDRLQQLEDKGVVQTNKGDRDRSVHLNFVKFKATFEEGAPGLQPGDSVREQAGPAVRMGRQGMGRVVGLS